MTSFNFKNQNVSTAQTLVGDNTGSLDATSVLDPAAGSLPVTWNTSTSPTATGVVLSNYGTIIGNSTRVIDATGTPSTTGKAPAFTLDNYGTISSTSTTTGTKGDLFRVNFDLPVASTLTVYNSGVMQASGLTNDSRAITLGKVYSASSITITNTASGTISTADADAIRPGNNSTITNSGTIMSGSSDPSTGAAYQLSSNNAIDISAAQSDTIINSGLISGAENGVGSDVSNSSTVTTPANYTITNAAAGQIVGRNGAGVASSGTGTITNAGTISGTITTSLPNGNGDGIDIALSGAVSNTGSILGLAADGYDVNGRANASDGLQMGGGTVDNGGVVEGATNGITIDNPGNANATRSGSTALTLVNRAGGLVEGLGGYAIRSENKSVSGTNVASLDNDTITNYGTIIGNGTVPSATVTLQSGAADPNTVGVLNGVTYTAANAGSARFISGDGAAVQTGEGNDVVSNYGTIVGNSGRAISFEGGNGTLNLYTGSSITGAINGGTGTSTINLGSAAGASTGTLSQVTNFASLNVNGGAWTITDGEAYGSGIAISSGATLVVGSAGATSGMIADNGVLDFAEVGTLSVADTISGTGSVMQAGSGTLVLAGADSFSGGIALSTGTLDLASSGAAGSGTITLGTSSGTGPILQVEAVALSAAGILPNTVAGFSGTDAIDLRGIGTATTASFNAVTHQLSVTGGSEAVTLQLDAAAAPASGMAYSVAADGAGGSVVTLAAASPVFTPDDLVVSISGDGDGSGVYTDNQATPIVLEDIGLDGSVHGTLVLPQSTTVVNGVTEYAISGEYGSSSEGSLELSADGHSLVIAGYAVNAQTYNAGGAAVYGNAALAQSTSLQGGTYTAVQRVIADITANGTVDTSTALYGVFNTNNPRSVATVDGSAFYISGQGVKGDTTQGLFLVRDGATTATAIDNTTDTRTAEIYNGQLYVSRDSKQGAGGTSNIDVYGPGLPTTSTAGTILVGISQSVTLGAGQGNTVNGSAVGSRVNLDPENFFFANSSTLYVADGGTPKQGGVGDGGLQKWSYSGGQWMLDYTLSQGLNLAGPGAAAGTTGLIGLTGKVVGDTVQLYATNETVGDLDQKYVFGINDSLSGTSGTGEAFATLLTAAADTNIRGIAFAPTAATPCFCRGTLILTDLGEVPVEDLAIGDRVVTLSGAIEPVRWIGRRAFAGRFLAGRRAVLPVLIRAGALGEGLPRRDLRVSPLHAMHLDGLLVPAGLLVNGTTIVQPAHCEAVEYFNIELDEHGVVWAEGAASETFLDDDSRGMFHNAAEYTVLYPDSTPAEACFCLPRVEDGYELEAVRKRLAAIAGRLGLVA